MLFDLRRHDGPSRPPQLAALPGNGLSSHKMPRETVGNDGGTMSYSRHIESIVSIVAAPPVAFIGDENAHRRGCGASDVSNFAQNTGRTKA